MAAAASSSSIALWCGGGKADLRGEDRMVGVWPPHPRRSCSVARRRWEARAVLASPAQQSVGNIAASPYVCVDPFGRRLVGGADHPRRDSGTGTEPVSPEKLDQWMRESVTEIVRNIGEAPFLVHVFSNNEGPAGLRLEREAADAESWPYIRRRWSSGAALPPDGVILVEELKGGEEQEEKATRASDDEDAPPCSDHLAASSSSSASSSNPDAASKTWGVVVQGRGTDGAACYILNTCRVRSSFGFCTHFCLARAKCFGDTADVQLKKVWLLGRRHHQQQQ